MAAVEDVTTQRKGVCLVKYDLRNNHNYGDQCQGDDTAVSTTAASTSRSIFDSFHFRQQQKIIQQQKRGRVTADNDNVPTTTSSSSTVQPANDNTATTRTSSSSTAANPMSHPAATTNTTVSGAPANDSEYYSTMADFHLNFPIKIVAFHVCYVDPSMIQRNWFVNVVLKYAVYDRARFRFHHGTFFCALVLLQFCL